jgi:2',3'-cyclic-nucleotide 2'-phosphodiesterase / 3'-nucleotidase / 5'-nucleotidase
MRIPTPFIALWLALAGGCARATVAPSGSSSAPATVELVVAATTDIHGRVRGWNYDLNGADPAVGLARAATIVDSLRDATNGRVILIDAGDIIQGNALGFVAARVSPSDAPHPVIAAMNVMRYDAAAIGNHEFNYGVPFLERAASQARFPLLAANAARPDGSRAFRGWTVVDRAGVKVGIVGATTPGSMVWDRDNLRGRVVLGDIVPAVRNAVAEARAAGAQLIVVTMHSGLAEPASYDTASTGLPSDNVAARVAREVQGVDVIAYGHSHKEMPDTTINGVLLMQAKNWVQSVAVANLHLVRDGAAWRVASKSSRLVRTAGHAESPAVLQATEPAHAATVAWVTTPIGRTDVAWRADSARVVDTPLLDFVLEVERRAANADLAAAAAFSLDASIDSGTITAARMQALYPYDNTLRAIRISGRQLREYLEFSARYYVTDANGGVSVDPKVPGFNFDVVAGADYVLDLARPRGQRVTKLEVRGRPVAPTDSFTLALTNYRQAGGGSYSMIAGAPVVYDKQLDIRQLLTDEVRRVGTLRPRDYFTPNWHLEPAGVVGQLYAQMHGGAAGATLAGAAAPARAARPPRPATRLRIIGTNDFHGALEPRTDSRGVRRGGAAYLAAAIRRARAECVAPECVSLFVDAGDQFQGTLASNLQFGRPVVRIFNRLGLVAAALGNHEFDWSQDTLRARMRDARYPILGANVRYADGRDVPWIRDDTLIVRKGLKVGIIGLASVLTARTTAARNVTGLVFAPPGPIVDSLARRLRARGADYVIVLDHDGAFCDRTGAAACRGEIVGIAQSIHEPIDLIVSGHTHSFIDATIAGVPVVQAYYNGSAIDVVDLGPSGTTHAVRNVLTDSIAPDPAIASLVRAAVDRVAPIVGRRIATIAEPLERDEPQYPLGNLIADGMRDAGQGDVAIMNNGGIRTALAAGVATYGSLFEIHPFGNTLYRITVTGATLRDYLERIVYRRGQQSVHVSGLTIVYDSTAAEGSRLRSVTMANGAPLDPAAQYRVILNDFMALGGEGLGFSTNAVRSENLGIVDLDALIAYLRKLPQPVHAPKEVRIVQQKRP